jgi:hypothetical protein
MVSELRDMVTKRRAGGLERDLRVGPTVRSGSMRAPAARTRPTRPTSGRCRLAGGGLLDLYRGCYRIAAGMSVIDANGATVTGFHQVLARDVPETTAGACGGAADG